MTRETPFFDLPLAEQIERAKPYAHRVLIGALEGSVSTDLTTIVHSIAGDINGRAVIGDDTADRFTDAIFAARAFGLCQGLMLRSEAFGHKGVPR